MSPKEVGWRALEQVKRRYAKGRLEGNARYADAERAVPVLPGLRAALLTAGAPERAAIANAAEVVLAGRFSALGVSWPQRSSNDLFPEFIWRMDPITGCAWSGSDYCFDIAYRHNRNIGDVKYVWEFGRLQFLQPLAAQAALTGEHRFIAAIERAISSFDTANPPFRGVHYAEILNVALRAISLLIVTSFCGEALSTVTVATVRRMLRSHLQWLTLFPSRFSSANNHLIAELAAEYMIVVSLGGPEERVGADGRLDQLVVELGKQIFSDGVSAEQSPSYGAYSAEFVLLAAAVARGEGRELPVIVEERLLAFARQIFWLADSRGLVPNICDNDEGRVLTLSTHEQMYPHSVAMAICGFFKVPASSNADPVPTLRSTLFGAATLRSEPPTGVHTFTKGGLTVARSAAGTVRYILTFDHGPLGYLAIAAHGHADALAITLNVDDQPLLVDPGTYLYHSGEDWRDWFRGTRAHNTLNVEGRNQSVISGPFNWSQQAKARLESVKNGRNWAFTGVHEGYKKALEVDHWRTVDAIPGGIRLVDRLRGEGALRPAEVVFQCAPGIEVEIVSEGVCLRRGGKPVARLEFVPSGMLTVAAGGDLGEGGWVSERFGERIPASRIAWSGLVPKIGLCTEILIDFTMELP